MSAAAIDRLTLREKLRNVEKLSRELADHLERGFIPKAHSLRRLARNGNEPETRESVSDIAIREAVSTVVSSDNYTQNLTNETKRYLRSIQADINAMFNE